MAKRIVTTLAGLALTGVVWFFGTLPRVARFRTEDPSWTALMEQRRIEAARKGRAFSVKQTWVPLASMPRHLERAIIAGEDNTYYRHSGIPWQALAQECRYRGDGEWGWSDVGDLWRTFKAACYCLRNRDRVRGRSGITQQVAKNLFFGTERGLRRKLRELFVARRLDRLGKRRVLELYINIAEFGPGIFGVEAAAQHYFGRPAAELTRAQAVELAATLPGPLVSNPDTRTAKFRRHLKRIQRSM